MFCPNCGKQLNHNDTYCNKCGYSFNQDNNQSTQFINPHQSNNQSNYSNKVLGKKLFVIIIIIIVIGAFCYLGKDYIFKDKKINNQNPQNNTQQSTDDKKNNSNVDNNDVVSSNDSFLFPIEDVFTITGRGTVVTGIVKRGSIKVGDEIEIVGLGEKKKAIVDGIEMLRESREEAITGDNAGLLLRDISREEVQRGQVLAKVNSIGLYTKFKANIYVLTKAEGGKSEVIFNGANVSFYVRTTDVSGKINNMHKIEPKLDFDALYAGEGDTFEIYVELTNSLALEKDTLFSIREGGRTVGGGIITEIIN